MTMRHCAGMGWSPGKNGVMAPRDAGKLSFSFALETSGTNPALALLRAQSLRTADVRMPLHGVVERVAARAMHVLSLL